MKWLLCILVSVSLLSPTLALVTKEEISLTIQVEAGKTECFFLPVDNPSYHTLELSYRMVYYGENDINVQVHSPMNELLANDVMLQSNSLRIPISGSPLGDYSVCFDNSYSVMTGKTVALSIYLLNAAGNQPDDDWADVELTPTQTLDVTVEVFKSSTANIKNNLNRISSSMSSIKQITQQDRFRGERNFENVNYWGIVNTFVMFVSVAVQVFLVRSLLTERSLVGKVLRGGYY